MAPTTLSPKPSLQSEEKAASVRQMFDRIAPTYDLLNDCISLGMHRAWKQAACRMLELLPGDRVLDLCTGTGDLVDILKKQVGPGGLVVGVDFSEEMLTLARQRFQNVNEVAFQRGDAMNLPFEKDVFDGAIVSFGLRNVADIDKAVAEMARVVRPGGWVVNLDTCPNPKLPGYWLYFNHVMPRIGKMLSKDPMAYDYLSASTRNFLEPPALLEKFEKAGLRNITCKALAFGSVSIQAGQK